MKKRTLCLLLAVLTALSLCIPAIADSGSTDAPTPTTETAADPTDGPTVEPTEGPTAEPTEEPAAEPTEEPTVEPTEEPTVEPTEEPTAEPTEEPTAEPTEEPTAEPSASPEAAEDMPDSEEGIMPLALDYTPDTTGKDFANLVLFAYFQDQTADASFFSDSANAKKLADFYDGTDSLSLTKYIDTVSAEALKLCNILPQYAGGTITAIQLPYDSTSVTATDPGNDYRIIADVLSELQKTVTIPGSSLDLNGDGIVDNLTVIIKGGRDLTPRRGNNAGASTIDSKQIGNYNFLYTYDLMEHSLANGVGLIAHEFLHSLGYPDLYRSSAPDDHPVSGWDVMGGVTAMPSWPLAYLRMHFTSWITLSEITNSQTLTFHAPGDRGKAGSEAYILKSPQNSSELFVVEMRRRNGSIDSTDVLDKNISSSLGYGKAGLIVYRVDTKVDGLSNFRGGTGVYVFRPNAGTTLQDVQDAYLNVESGRTSMGFDDASKTLADGALTFSNGTNSRILIQNVADNRDGTMRCDVVIPAAEDFELWDDTFIELPGNDQSTVATVSLGGKQYAAVFDGEKFIMRVFDGAVWTTVGGELSAPAAAKDSVCMISHDGKLYLAYADGATLTLQAFDPAAGAWASAPVTYSGSCSNISMQSLGGALYVNCTQGSALKLLKLEGNTLQPQPAVPGESGAASFKTASVDGTLYAAVQDITYSPDGKKISVYRQADGGFEPLPDAGIASNTYFDLAELNGQLVVVTSNQKGTSVHTYDGAKWTSVSDPSLRSSDARMIVVGGTLYLASSDSGSTRVLAFDGSKWTQVGENVDAPADDISLSSDGKYLYVSFVRTGDHAVVVRRRALPAAASPTEPTAKPPASVSPSPSPSASPSPSPAVTPTLSPVSAQPSAAAAIPDTGDGTPLALYAGVLAVSTAALALLLWKKRRTAR